MRDRPQHVDPDDGALLRAKALSAPSRVEILRRLNAAGTPLTVGVLATELGIHQTAVRQHLALLLDAGLVRSQPLPVIGRGRPRIGYAAVVQGDPYRELAGMLADGVRLGRTAREAGRYAGLQVPPSTAGPLVTLCEEASRLGFEPLLQRRGKVAEIVLQACPFADLATDQPETVCQLHVGLAEGIAERAGGMVVDGIRLAQPREGGCRIVVRETPI